MSHEISRRTGVGGAVDDLCRVCKMPRRHTVIALDEGGAVRRVVCDTCGSQHNYRRGGPPTAGARGAAGPNAAREAPPVVSERERSREPMSLDASTRDLELLLRRVIREEIGLTPVAPADRWSGGHLVLRPGRAGVQEKSWPIETFFHKVVMLRNRLRVLEQQINGAELPDELKLKLQSYITGCYGTLTSFNVLFADEDDRFKGTAGD
jgi:hypothetical protein